MKHLFNILAGLGLLSLLVACGGSGGSSDPSSAPSTGIFLDSAVEGIGARQGSCRLGHAANV